MYLHYEDLSINVYFVKGEMSNQSYTKENMGQKMNPLSSLKHSRCYYRFKYYRHCYMLYATIVKS